MARLMKDSGIEWIGEIPENWRIYRNKVVFSCNKEIVGEDSSNTQLLSLTTSGVKTKDINAVGGKLPESFDTYQYVSIDDIVMCLFDLDMSAVFSGISKYEGMISPAYKVLKCNNKYITPKYADYWFKFIFVDRKFTTYAKNLRYTLSYDEFGVLSIPIPSLSEQQKIAEFLDEKCSHIDSVLDKTNASIEEYKKLKQAVITQAVTKGIRPYRPMKDSGIEWIGEIPEDWRTVKLKYLSIEIGDGLHSTPNYDTEGNIYFINGNNIGAEALVFKSDTSRINEIEFAKYKQPIMNENTILITLNGATYGKTSYYNNEKILLGKSAGYITLKCEESKQFLRYYLQSTIAKTIMDLSLNGTTIANLSLTTLNNFLIIYPSIVEQQEIVSYLNAKCAEIDKLIEKKEQLISELETYKKSLIYEYVTGKKEVC